MLFAVGLGLGIPGVLVAATGIALVVVGLLRYLGSEDEAARSRPSLAAALPFGSLNARGLSYAGLW
jgi:hypothetical protein